jgi:hypothetical protein
VARRTVKADTEQKAGRSLGEGSAQEVPTLIYIHKVYSTGQPLIFRTCNPESELCVTEQQKHGLINCIDTKRKCHHLLKLTCKGTLPQVFIRVYRLQKQSLMLVSSVCGGGGGFGVLGLRQINLFSPLKGKFFLDDDILLCLP